VTEPVVSAEPETPEAMVEETTGIEVPEPIPKTVSIEPPLVSNIEVIEQEDTLRVIISGSEPLTYNLNQEESPSRLVVDLEGVKLDVPNEAIPVNKGVITEIIPSEIEEEGESFTRIEIGLNTNETQYEVIDSGSDIFIDFSTSQPVKKAENIVDLIITESENFVQVDILADGKIEEYKSFELNEPSRLVLDFPGVKSQLLGKEKESSNSFLERIRWGEHKDYLRIVLDSSQSDLPPFEVIPTKAGVRVFLGSEFEKKKEEIASIEPSSPILKEETSEKAEAEGEEIASEGEGAPSEENAPQLLAKAEIERNKEVIADPPSSEEVDPEETADPELKTEEPLEEADSEGAVDPELRPEGSDLESSPEESSSSELVESSEPNPSLETEVEETPEPAPEEAEESSEEKAAEASPTPEEGSSEVSEAAAEVAATPPPSAETSAPLEVTAVAEEPTPRYTGTHISLDFKDADIRNILRLIAEVSNLNIVAGDDVQGTVTLRLTDVPWDQALDVILLSNNLGKTLEGNILRVAPIERLNRERQAAIAARETEAKLEPLKKGLIPVSYADASELKDVIINSKVLSPRGSIEIDQRTNTMIVIDIEKNIREVRRIIDQLDTPTPQVLIEAKIVQINPSYTKELGISWEGGYATSHGNDALIGVGGQEGVEIDLGTGTVTTKGSIVDLAPAVGPGVGGGISFGYLKPGFGIFQKIAGLEKEEKLEILSSPRIMTLDNQEAIIEQGVDLPYLKLSEEGVTSTEFKKATLSLKVTPHVTADGSIMMDIEVKKDQKSAQTGAGGEPGIDTRRAETKVLVRNGDTVVIGGIYEENTTDIYNSVPFLGRIPLINFFFKSTTKKREKTELIVFITPTIVTIPKKPLKLEEISSSPLS